jgi:hypothetical protein
MRPSIHVSHAHALALALIAAFAACGPGPRPPGAADAGNADAPDPIDADLCPRRCSADLHAVVDCNDVVVTQCPGSDACDANLLVCTNACAAAESSHRSIGCEYYATSMETFSPGFCFAAFVANTWNAPAHIDVSYQDVPLDVASFARLPVGSGSALNYPAYDPVAGLAPGEVAVLFLTGQSGGAPYCPVPAAVASTVIAGTGIGDAFRITTDVPVVAYQINPFGGGAVAVTAASLLLPTSAWDTNYVAVNVAGVSAREPSLNIVAREDETIVTLTPTAQVVGGNGVPSGAAGQPIDIRLDKGQHAQITQAAELTGSIVTSNQPVGFMAGHVCMNMPTGVSYCDHGEQMIPPVRALGNRYVGVMYRPRPGETSTYWRVIGAVDGTALTWSSSVGGPATIDKGQAVTFQTGTPFVVESQDADHPFMLFAYMTGSGFVADGYGDPDFVIMVPPEQYLQQYVFFADPTYPETNVVVVRSRGANGQFHDVTLDCAGTLTGWTPIGADYELVRVDLSTGNFMSVGGCTTGPHEIHSTAPFGLWVWGWGTPLTIPTTENVSYGYPGGMNVAPINTVVIE